MIQLITANETHPLRAKILRAGIPNPEVEFSFDEEPTTLHWGKFDGTELIGIVSAGINTPGSNCTKELKLDNSTFIQFRGMAVAKKYRGVGIGMQLIEKMEKDLIKIYGNYILWCNARETAKDFYLKNRFSVWSKSFYVELIGTHYVMGKYINGNS